MSEPAANLSSVSNPSTADACDREARWLRTTGDGLPSLGAPAGPWHVIQAYWPGTRFETQKPGIYVIRVLTDDIRAGGGRIRPQHAFRLRLWWPVKASGQAPLAEGEQRAFDSAINLLLVRVRGLPGDKTHGGWFLSAGEVPRTAPPQISWDDPEPGIEVRKALTASLTYRADDFELDG